MDIKNDIKTGFKLAADAATDIAQVFVEKSRLRAKAHRIKQIIKKDAELRNQAYIELGRYYYDNLRNADDTQQEALCVVVDKTTARIDKASRKYVELLNQSGEIKFESDSGEKIKQIITDKAIDIKEKSIDKAKDFSDKAKDKAKDLSDKAKEKTQDVKAKAKEAVADISDKAKSKVDDFKSFIAPDEDLDDIIENDDDLTEMIAQQEQMISKSQQAQSNDDVNEIDDEESPEDFSF